MAEKSPTVLRKGERLSFFRSICPCLQVLNFGNNVLQFNVDAAFPFQTRMCIRVHCRVPYRLIPQAIKNYLKANYPRQTVKKLEIKKNEYEVELANGLDLTFNNRFQLVDMD